jgi:hypothetical protein
MVIGRTSGARTVDACTAVPTMPELQFSDAVMPAMPADAALSHGRPHTPTVSNWRLRGEVCLQNAVVAEAQGGRNAGYGAYDVTDSKFSTAVGPPSCSPPV